MPSASLLSRAFLAVVLALAVSACGDETGPRVAEPFVSTFDRMWTTVDHQYSYFEYKGIDWEAVRRQYRPLAERATSTAELVGVVHQALATLRDVHVWIVTPQGRALGTFDPQHRRNWSPTTRDAMRQRADWVSESPVLGHTSVDGVAYVALESLDAGRLDVRTFDRVLDRYRGAPALLLDVRMNAGGNDALAYQVAGRFAAQVRTGGYFRFRSGWRHGDFTSPTPRTVMPRGEWQFTRPVVVLAGRGTFSAAEGLVSALRELPNVTIVGDTTGGGSGNPSVFPLRDGYGIAVSRWIEYTAQGRPIEWQGIAPDIAVDAGTVNVSVDAAGVAADTVAHPSHRDAVAATDPVLARALAVARREARQVATYPSRAPSTATDPGALRGDR